MTDNPLALREWLQHAYEETLDQAVYLKRAIEEMDKPAWIKEGERVSVRPNVVSGWWCGYVTLVTGDEAYVSVEGTTLPFKMRKNERGTLWQINAPAPVSAPSFAMHKHVGVPDPVQTPRAACDWIAINTPIQVSDSDGIWSNAVILFATAYSARVRTVKGDEIIIFKDNEGTEWRRGVPAPVQPPSAEDPPWMHV